VLPVEIAFDENRRLGQRVFSGYIRSLVKPAGQPTTPATDLKASD
jgi:hypothetical protein